MTYQKSTLGIHGRQERTYHAAVFPIYQTSTFGFENSDDIPPVMRGEAQDEYLYSRLANPTVRNVEERLAQFEYAEDAALFASGMAAITASIMAHVRQGDTIVASRPLYGGTYHLLSEILPRYNIKTVFLEAEQLYDLEHYAPQASVIFFETPANPTCSIIDIEKVVASARQIGAVTIIDNTFASPINQNPLTMGVDVVLHSATKYLGGHSDFIAGAVMSSAERMVAINEYRVIFGGCLAPFEAFLLDRSLKTLKARVDLHNRSAKEIADFFVADRRIKQVYYPGLQGTCDYDIAVKQMHGFSGMLAVELESGDDAKLFVDSLKLALNAVSLGSVETLVTIPALSTHLKVNEEELRVARVTSGTVRISVGLEDTKDLIEDFEQALARL